jgi:hypothetical protein
MYRFNRDELILLDIYDEDHERELRFNAADVPSQARMAFAQCVAEAYEVGFARGSKHWEALGAPKGKSDG